METMSFKSLLKKERAAKAKADKSKKTAASSYNFGAFSAPKPVVKPKTTPVSKPKPKPVATSKAKPKPKPDAKPIVNVQRIAPNSSKTTNQLINEFVTKAPKTKPSKPTKYGKATTAVKSTMAPSKVTKPLTSKTPAKAVNKPSTSKTVAKPVNKPLTKTTVKPVNKPVTKVPAKTTNKPAAKTVSQVWKEKTGTDWSEAKKQGLTDGSAKANLALLDKLNKGDVGKKAEPASTPTPTPSTTTTPTPTPTPTPTASSASSTPKPTAKQMAGSGMGAMERMEGMYRRGGSIKKYQNGGMTGAAMKAKGTAMKAKGEGMKLKGQGQAMKVAGKKMQAEGDVLKYAGQNPVRTKISKSLGLPLQSRPTGIAGTYMKTGGMVNSNAKISALKSAGSKGVKSGVNPKAAVSKVAKGRVGGTSAAPKTATPKRK